MILQSTVFVLSACWAVGVALLSYATTWSHQQPPAEGGPDKHPNQVRACYGTTMRHDRILTRTRVVAPFQRVRCHPTAVAHGVMGTTYRMSHCGCFTARWSGGGYSSTPRPCTPSASILLPLPSPPPYALLPSPSSPQAAAPSTITAVLAVVALPCTNKLFNTQPTDGVACAFCFPPGRRLRRHHRHHRPDRLLGGAGLPGLAAAQRHRRAVRVHRHGQGRKDGE